MPEISSVLKAPLLRVPRLMPAALVFAAAAAWAAPPAPAIPPVPAQYLHDTWQREDGLPQISVMAIVQDPRGYLWLGTEEGLARFDGVDFTVRDRESTPELRSSYVEVLLVDREGSLWIGTYDGLTHLADGRFRVYTTADGLAHGHVRALHQDRAGRLWIGTLGGVSCLDGGRFRTYTTRDGLSHDVVWAILEDREGDLWIGTQGGLSRLSEGRFTTYHTSQGLSHDHVLALQEDRQGDLWIGTLKGLSRFADGRFVVYTPEEGLAHPTVWTLYEDRGGNLWIGTDGGLNRFHDGVFTTFTTAQGMPDDEVRAIWEDQEGSLWVGTRLGGLWRLREGKFTTLGRSEGLADDVVWSILQDRSGSVWIGTNQGLTRIAPDGATTTYSTRDGLPSSDVRSLCEDREGNLWAGTFAYGLARLRDGAFRIFTTDDGLPAPGVFAIAEDRQGSLWVGTDGGLSRLVAGRFTTFTTRDGLPNNAVRVLYHDPAGVLWIGTEGGLARYQDGAFTTFDRQDGLADALITAIYADPQGTLWLGTFEGGLSRLRDGEFTNFSIRDGLFDNRVHQILEDGRGRLWMSSNKGIFRVRKQELEDFAGGRTAAITSVSYDESDGMRSRECNGSTFHPAGWRTRDGRLWFPTLRGAAIIAGDNPPTNPVPPPVYIEEVLVDKQPMDPTRAAQLPPGTREIEFRYTALSFIEPERIRFRYRLEGFDDDWKDDDSHRSAHYTSLPPGPYRFLVIASNSDGVWNETGAFFDLDQRPAFYQTWSFYLASAASVVLLALGVHRLRVRQLLRRNLELHRLKMQLEAQNLELERKNAEVEAKSAEIERFTYAVSHDLKSPLFTIGGFLGMLEKDAARGDAERMAADIGRIRSAAEKMDQLLTELLDLSRIGRMVNPPQQVSLTELAREAVEAVGGRTAERGVEVVVAPDLPTVVGDRPRLLQVFQNLIDNAVKFMGSQDQPRVEITATRESADGGRVVLCRVRDNGMGIDPRYHEKVFGLFDQLDPKAGGTGIGLTVVRRIIELHGGRIWVDSAGHGEGSTFSFSLPTQGLGRD